MRIRMTLGAALLLAASAAQAQTLEEKLEKKLAKPFVENVAWVQDYDAALAKAKESGRIIFAYFSRSYAP